MNNDPAIKEKEDIKTPWSDPDANPIEDIANAIERANPEDRKISPEEYAEFIMHLQDIAPLCSRVLIEHDLKEWKREKLPLGLPMTALFIRQRQLMKRWKRIIFNIGIWLVDKSRACERIDL